MGFDLGHIADGVGGFLNGLPVVGGAIHAVGQTVATPFDVAKAVTENVARGDMKNAVRSLGAGLQVAFPVGSDVLAQLVTGGNPLDAAKKDLEEFKDGAQVAQGVVTGNPVGIYNAATNYGAVVRSDLPVPSGAGVQPHPIDLSGMNDAAQIKVLEQVHPIYQLHAAAPDLKNYARPVVAIAPTSRATALLWVAGATGAGLLAWWIASKL